MNAAGASSAPPWSLPPNWLVYGVIVCVIAGLAIALAALSRRLGSDPTWSLGAALSEETDLTVPDATGQPYSINGSVVKKTVLAASSSRVIAFAGLLAILGMFIGFGVFILWNFGKTGTIAPGTADATQFLLGGTTLFVPYAVNKISSIFSAK